MIINEANLDHAFKGFKARYTDAYSSAPSASEQIAMTVPSTAQSETYGWLGQFPQLREWLDGDRVIKGLEAFGFTIENIKFESTIGVKRENFADDSYGVYAPMMAEMGNEARSHSDKLLFGLLGTGFSELCYDGQPFFDAEHPATAPDGAKLDGSGNPILSSNFQDGAEESWFLLDTSRSIRPLIWQERENYDFQSLTSHQDGRVFMTDIYLYGIRARVNAGLGLWQMAYGSKAALTPANYAAARSAMQMQRGDSGRVLGVKPTVMVVPPSLEEKALHILNTEFNDGGGSNPWSKTAELIVTPYVSA